MLKKECFILTDYDAQKHGFYYVQAVVKPKLQLKLIRFFFLTLLQVCPIPASKSLTEVSGWPKKNAEPLRNELFDCSGGEIL